MSLIAFKLIDVAMIIHSLHWQSEKKIKNGNNDWHDGNHISDDLSNGRQHHEFCVLSETVRRNTWKKVKDEDFYNAYDITICHYFLFFVQHQFRSLFKVRKIFSWLEEILCTKVGSFQSSDNNFFITKWFFSDLQNKILLSLNIQQSRESNISHKKRYKIKNQTQQMNKGKNKNEKSKCLTKYIHKGNYYEYSKSLFCCFLKKVKKRLFNQTKFD
ncbi:hypothetical protein RFI_31408 [Reticulomyxa filosa]|uniref:Uncharacterized protein n=1 Tax=Reticulomyxa filosa TaxID=46433 RepID=X6LVN4_RETFI|nr:hypothetical protein RFI_31408 [Reticulomyxa filosa]|eukprot:ETO05988.1 hypothetical protein RFI_31408 [Reticulomyxa filosa]